MKAKKALKAQEKKTRLQQQQVRGLEYDDDYDDEDEDDVDDELEFQVFLVYL
jgi:hypothetical protein